MLRNQAIVLSSPCCITSLLRHGVAHACVVFLVATSAYAGTIYSEDFESVATDTGIVGLTNLSNVGHGFVVATAAGNSTNKLVVRGPSSTLGNDLTALNVGWSGSQFGQWYDNVTNGTVMLLVGRFAPLSNSPYSITFDYYEPTGYTSANQFTLVTGDSDALNTTSNRALNLLFGNLGTDTSETFQTVGSGSSFPATLISNATLNAKHTLQIFGILGSVSGSPLTYKGCAESVSDNTYDVWLDGTKIIDNVDYRNANGITTWSRIGFSLGTTASGVDVKYVDNIVVTDDLVGPVPEPASILLVGMMSLFASAMIRRR